VAAFPSDAGPDEFMWRVSIAEVRVAGPFSAFPETDRHLSVLEGTLLLSVAGQPSATLAPDTAGLAFPGDVAASGTPVNGPVLDLNVMVRRGRFRAEVAVLAPGQATTLEAGTAILVATAPTHIECGDDRPTLDRLDAVRLAGQVGTRLSIRAGGPAHLIQILAIDSA
jgi:environmental stress-induced protein Ves